MSIKSPKQYGLMQAIAHGTSNSGIGPSPEVAKEFVSKTPKINRKKFAKTLFKKKI